MKRMFVAAAALLVMTAAYAGSPFDWGKVLQAGTDLVKSAKGATEEEEIALGREWAATLLGAAPLLRDDAAQNYVNQVGRWLSLHSERPNLSWRFGVLDSPNINAFATPGGFVFVTKGLLQQVHSEAELAGVLSHEIAHVVRKHHLNAVMKAKGVGIGADVLQQLAVNKGNNADVAGKVVGGLKEVALRGLDKSDEYESDRMALVIAARAGYDPFGLTYVLQTLQALNAQDSSLALLFETHPAPSARLDALESATAGGSLDAVAGQPQNPERYARSLRLR